MLGLRRVLGYGSLTFYGVGLILGAGIYTIIGAAAGVSGASLWLAFLLASAVALLTGLSYCELATMYPRAGAEFVYLGKAWPRAPWLRSAVGWTMALAGAATAATAALAFGGYGSALFPTPGWALALALVVAAGALNVLGVREAGWTNVLFTLVEASGLVALVIVGVREPAFGERLLAGPPAGILAGAGLVFFAFLGFENVANLAEEARDPARDLPRAILTAVAVSTALYVLVALASVALVEPDRLAESRAPLAEAMRAGAPGLAGALGGVALFATANTALISITTASRLLYGIARGGDAPPAFETVMPSRRTPVVGIVAVTLAAALLLPLGRVALVGSVASFLALVAFVSVNAALVRLRRTAPRAKRPFRVPWSVRGWPVLPALGLALCVVVASQLDPLAYLIGAGALLLGVLMGRVRWRRGDSARTRGRSRRRAA